MNTICPDTCPYLTAGSMRSLYKETQQGRCGMFDAPLQPVVAVSGRTTEKYFKEQRCRYAKAALFEGKFCIDACPHLDERNSVVAFCKKYDATLAYGFRKGTAYYTRCMGGDSHKAFLRSEACRNNIQVTRLANTDRMANGYLCRYGCYYLDPRGGTASGVAAGEPVNSGLDAGWCKLDAVGLQCEEVNGSASYFRNPTCLANEPVPAHRERRVAGEACVATCPYLWATPSFDAREGSPECGLYKAFLKSMPNETRSRRCAGCLRSVPVRKKKKKKKNEQFVKPKYTPVAPLCIDLSDEVEEEDDVEV